MNPLHYGVVVGINRYPDLNPLKRAKGDAESFGAWLTDPHGGGLPPQNVELVVVEDAQMPDGTLRENAVPTRNEVLSALHRFRKTVNDHIDQHPDEWKNTRLYFYVSGHGIAPGPRDAALLMANASPEWAGENLSCSQLLSFFGESQTFHELVIFADCCRERLANAPLSGVPWPLDARDNGSVLTALGCATHFGDIALEPDEEMEGETDPDKLRGYFTKALLEGLWGQAVDGTNNGEVNSNSLARYVRQRVCDLTKHRRHQQRPTMDSDPAEPIIFRQDFPGVSEVKHQVRLQFVTPFSGKALLLNGIGDVIAEHQVPGDEWVIALTNSIYQITPENAGAEVHFRNDGFFKVWGEERDVQL